MTNRNVANPLKQIKQMRKVGDVQKKLGEMWRKMTPAERQPFVDQANEEKKVYLGKCGKFANPFLSVGCIANHSTPTQHQTQT